MRCRDQAWRWSFLHALFAVKDDINEDIRDILIHLHRYNPGLLNLLVIKDIDGDTPMHSVIKTGNTKRLRVLLDQLKSWDDLILIEVILETKNNEGYTPLLLACVERRHKMVESLLEVCIREGFCQDVTGVAIQSVSAKMLPEALAKGNWKILEIFLRVLKKFNYPPEEMIKILNLPNEKGERTWCLQMECDAHALKKTCRVLSSSEYDICLDELHTDEYGSTMLHVAYRTNCSKKIAILIEFGCDLKHINYKKWMACERSHTLHKTCMTQQAQSTQPKSLTSCRPSKKHSNGRHNSYQQGSCNMSITSPHTTSVDQKLSDIAQAQPLEINQPILQLQAAPTGIITPVVRVNSTTYIC